jgi:hypothetical protein
MYIILTIEVIVVPALLASSCTVGVGSTLQSSGCLVWGRGRRVTFKQKRKTRFRNLVEKRTNQKSHFFLFFEMLQQSWFLKLF